MSQRMANVLALLVLTMAVTSEVVAFVLTGLAPGENQGAPVGIEMAPTVVGFSLVGAWLLHRRPQHRVGWLVAGVGASNAIGAGAALLAGSLITDPGATTLAVTLELLSRLVQEFSIVLAVVLLPVLFPTGVVHSARWRWLPRTALGLAVVSQFTVVLLADEYDIQGGSYANPYGVESLRGPMELLSGMTFLATILLVIPAITALVLRFRAAEGIERLQLRWFVFSMVTFGVTLAVLLSLAGLWNLGLVPDVSEMTFDLALMVPLTAMPLSIGAAVLRYRLYEVDRIVSRTVSYTLLTFVLAAVYVTVVLAAQSVAGVRGDAPDVVVAGATLLVAALFHPLRRRVQAAVDRRFARARVDAAALASRFGARLRDRVQLEHVADELGAVVERALAPKTVSLWIPTARDVGQTP